MPRKKPRDLPARVPEQLGELDQAVMLLGNRAQQDELKKDAKTRLQQLIGEYPSQKQAAAWKVALKGLAREMRELGDAPPPRARKVVLDVPPPPRRRRSRKVFVSEEALAAGPGADG